MPIAVSPDGQTGAFVGLRASKGIVVVSLTDGKVLRVIKNKSRRFSSFCKSLHFSPKGDLLILAIDRDILTFDPKTGNPGLEWKDTAKVQALSNFFEGGKKIASVNENGDIKIWEVATGKQVGSLSGGDQTRTLAAPTITFTDDGKTAVSRDSKYKIWDAAAGKLRHEIKESLVGHPHIRILPGNRHVVWNTSLGFVIYDLETGVKKQEVKASETFVHALAVKPDGSMILTGSEDSTIKGWALNAEGVVE